jgi:polyadenylate-binding protein
MEDWNTLFISNLSTLVTEAKLYDIFIVIGPMTSIRIVRDTVTRRSLGHGFINFLKEEDGRKFV